MAVVTVNIEGGLVQAVGFVGDGEPTGVVVIDYDTDGIDPDEVSEVPQDGDGDTAEAYVRELGFIQWEGPVAEWIAAEYL